MARRVITWWLVWQMQPTLARMGHRLALVQCSTLSIPVTIITLARIAARKRGDDVLVIPLTFGDRQWQGAREIVAPQHALLQSIQKRIGECSSQIILVHLQYLQLDCGQ